MTPEFWLALGLIVGWLFLVAGGASAVLHRLKKQDGAE